MDAQEKHQEDARSLDPGEIAMPVNNMGYTLIQPRQAFLFSYAAFFFSYLSFTAQLIDNRGCTIPKPRPARLFSFAAFFFSDSAFFFSRLFVMVQLLRNGSHLIFKLGLLSLFSYAPFFFSYLSFTAQLIDNGGCMFPKTRPPCLFSSLTPLFPLGAFFFPFPLPDAERDVHVFFRIVELILNGMEESPQLSEEMAHRAKQRTEKVPESFEKTDKKALTAVFFMMMVMVMMGRMPVFSAAHGSVLHLRCFFLRRFL